MLRSVFFLAVVLSFFEATAADWSRFRGPNGAGVAVEAGAVPLAWSAEANLAWKAPLPGPGASSPIIIGNRVFLTCYSGYGLSRETPGDLENLVRHVVCFDLVSGNKLWQRDVEAAQPEDPYTGAGVPAHGYASHTPVSDGTNVYAFLGKSGVHAFDLDGNELWTADVGMESDPTKWGSSSSPVIYNNTVIVTASAESQAVIGFDRSTGKEVWRQEAEGLDGMWGTPALVQVDNGRTDVVMCVAGELWGLDPDSGHLRWYAKATDAQHAYTSVIHDGNRVFAFTGRGGGSIAVDVNGSGDIGEEHTAWTGRDTASFASPVQHGSRLYVVASGIVTAVDAQSGERLQRLRLKGVRRSGGRFGSLDYPSPVIAGDHMFYLNGSGQMFVLSLGDEVRQVRINEVTQDKEDFRGTPAISGGCMILRSSKYVYCVTDKGDTVAETQVTKADPEEPAASDGGRRRGRFDPMAMFDRADTNKDDQLSEDELEGNRMADRLRTLDKDEDGLISKEEFRSGISQLFRRGRYGSRGKDPRPDRPQRPETANL